MHNIQSVRNKKTYLQEIQPVIELLNEGKRYGAQSICDIIAHRYWDEGEEGRLSKPCRALFREITMYIAGGEEMPTLDEIRTHYKILKEESL